MNNLFRLFMAAGLCLIALILLLMGLARQDADLLAPLNFFLFLVAIAIYLLPTVLAVYRDCESALWIAVVDVFLGWTLVGWIVALGWAASGKIKPLPPHMAPPSHPLPSH